MNRDEDCGPMFLVVRVASRGRGRWMNVTFLDMRVASRGGGEEECFSKGSWRSTVALTG